jgi:hypothetical protein
MLPVMLLLSLLFAGKFTATFHLSSFETLSAAQRWLKGFPHLAANGFGESWGGSSAINPLRGAIS